MLKTRNGSRIEVWSDDYINNPKGRRPADMDAVIVQIEPSNDGKGNYMVEVVDYE